MVINRMLSLRDGPMKTAFFPSNLPSNQAGQSTAAATPLPPSRPPGPRRAGRGKNVRVQLRFRQVCPVWVNMQARHSQDPGCRGSTGHTALLPHLTLLLHGGRGVFAWVRPGSDVGQVWVKPGSDLGQDLVRPGSHMGEAWVRLRSELGQSLVSPGRRGQYRSQLFY